MFNVIKVNVIVVGYSKIFVARMKVEDVRKVEVITSVLDGRSSE